MLTMRALQPILLIAIAISFVATADATTLLTVRRKFQSSTHSAVELRAHDSLRHARILSAIDLPLGGSSVPTIAGLYFAEVWIGTPARRFFVQVDTGSDILWVNCVTCKHCPLDSSLDGVDLALYDPKVSTTARFVTCDEKFCLATYNEFYQCSTNLPCQYSVSYGDGSSTSGYFVTDFITLNHVYAHDRIKQLKASVSFGCGYKQLGGNFGSSSGALDGILGFGQSNSSMLSQLASSGKVKKIFSHCLDIVKGGGIFAIGQVVSPKVRTTPMMPTTHHYHVNMKAIEVGGTFLHLPSYLFENKNNRGTIIDSGTTLTYIAEDAYKPLINAIFSNHKDIRLHSVEDILCFNYNGSVDDEFPEVVFHFEGSLQLTVHPHDYFFKNGENLYCVGWLNGGSQFKDSRNIFLLGDLVLSNKLVVYDLENRQIGWTDHNCSSSIKIQDDITREVHIVNAHNLSSGNILRCGSIIMLLLTIFSYLIS